MIQLIHEPLIKNLETRFVPVISAMNATPDGNGSNFKFHERSDTIAGSIVPPKMAFCGRRRLKTRLRFFVFCTKIGACSPLIPTLSALEMLDDTRTLLLMFSSAFLYSMGQLYERDDFHIDAGASSNTTSFCGTCFMDNAFRC